MIEINKIEINLQTNSSILQKIKSIYKGILQVMSENNKRKKTCRNWEQFKKLKCVCVETSVGDYAIC